MGVDMKAMLIGGRLRRLRQERRLTQAQMAAALHISASYLNLLEANRRPVTARVLVQLADKFQVAIGDLAPRQDENLEAQLLEALSDPVFEEHDVRASDVRDLVATLPALGKTLLTLYRSHHERAQSTTEPSDEPLVGSDRGVSVLPSEEVTDLMQQRGNFFPDLEAAANQIWRANDLSLHTLHHDLVRVLSQRYAVQVEIVPADRMPNLLRHYSPLTRRLELSEMLPLASRTFQMAYQLAFFSNAALIDKLSTAGKLTSPESDALARSALANYFAGALLMPYDRFLEAAKSTRYEIEVLQNRFGASFEQVCHRLTTLRRPGHEGVPFHLIRVDTAGNISKRFSASGMRIARFGAACPRWNVFDAFATPGMLRFQVSRMPDGQTFFCVAKTVATAGRSVTRGTLPQRSERRAIVLGCEIGRARDLGYADGLQIGDEQIVTPIGVSCRTCPRTDCSDRAMPAINQKLQLDENQRGLSPFLGAT
jgi:predicted transcriptional regulator/transcriptional regulator with XRE-family HTH domain